MRISEYRGKPLRSEWAYGNIIQCKNDGFDVAYIYDNSYDETEIGAYDRKGTVQHEDLMTEVRRSTVGEYTGLNDCNGKMIYEGDIVVIPGEYMWFDDGLPNYVGVVDWVFSSWQVIAHCVNPNRRGVSDGMNEELNSDGWADDDCTTWGVIGNIHDNPELLKKGDA